MAKIAPKGKKVVGTKKKDKITWVSTKLWNKNLTVKAGAGNDVINFKKSKYKNTIYGEAGADKIYGGKGADKIYGGKGNDTINAGKGNNTLYFSKGGGTDTLVFKTEKSLSGIKAAYSGNNAVITYNGGSVVLKDYKKGGHSAKYVKVGSTKKSIADLLKPPSPIVDGYYVINGTSGNDNLVAKDGYDCKISGGAGNDTITGGAGNDKIYGTSGNNILNGGAGNDSIYSGTDNNTINGGDGADYIDVTNGTNLIIFDDVKPNWSGGNSLIETVSGFKNSDTIQVTVTQDGWHGMAPMFFDSKTKDLYLGVQGSGTYNIKITDYSNETRNGWISVDGNDAIRMSEFLTQNQMYLHTDEADNLSDIPSGTYYMLGGNDVVTGNVREVSYSEISIYAGDGNDSITGIGADYVTIYGEDGNDTISTDTYTIGDGTIYGGVGDDEITANDQRVKTILYGEDGNDKLTGGQYMDGGAGNDTITSSATGNTESSSRATYIIGGEGDDEMHVYNTHYNPVIYDFYLNQSDGNDVIYDDLVSIRQLRFMQRSQDKSFLDMVNEIRYAKNGNDLIIKYKDNNSDLYRNSITIKNYMISENQTNLRFYDSSGGYQLVKTFIDTYGIELNGTDGDDVIYGSANADAIYAGDGDDFIYAGRGNDRIHAGAGNNTMVFYNRYYFDGSNKYDNANDGNDIVYTNGGGVDTLDFGQSIAVKYEKSDNDLIIKYNFDPASHWEAKSTVTLKDFYDSTVNNSTQYIKLLGQDAIELKPEELTPDAITTHNGSILCSSNSNDMRFDDNNNYYTAIGSNGDNIITVDTTASETYYLDGELGNDVYSIDSLNPKVIIYDSDNIGKVNVYTGSFTTNNNIFCDMQVTVEDGVVTACDYNSLNIYRTGQFDQGIRIMASPNLAGVTDGTPAQSISRVDDGGNSKKLTDISGLAQETANWIAATKADGIYSTAALVSAGGDDASAILAIVNKYWQNY